MYIYFIGANSVEGNLEAIKIGKANNPSERLSQIQSSTHLNLELMGCRKYKSSEDALNAEKYYHEKFGHIRIRGEWFKVSNELVKVINSIETTIDDLPSCITEDGFKVLSEEGFIRMLYPHPVANMLIRKRISNI